MQEDVKLKMRTLVDELNEASKAYYGGEKELMSDHEWNDKFDELANLEKETGFVFPDSPTQNVSKEEDVEGGVVVKHEEPALSLPKSKSVSDVIDWTEGLPVDLSWKLDGMTLVITWDNGKLTRVVTRHDGITGYDITYLADAISNVPKVIPYSGHLVVRGEAVMSYDDFYEVNERYGRKYENPRNLVAGSLNPRTKSVNDIIDRCITWVPFTLVRINSNDSNVQSSWRARMEYLRSLGFETVDSVFVLHPTLHLSGEIEKWSNKVDNYKYPVDGLVVVYDDVVYASEGEDTIHHNTRGGFAFKWEDEEKETELVMIDWSPSVNSINPVAIFEPVRLEGTTVSRASLCNLSEMKRLGIGGPGTKVGVVKANKIIPKVVRAEVPEGVSVSFDMPTVCPVCKSSTAVAVSENGIETLVCTNVNCVGKNLRKFERFVCKYGFNIMGLSTSTLEKFAQAGFVSNYVGIMRIPNNELDIRRNLVGHYGIGDKTISNLIASINKAKHVKADAFLYALCIPTCGRDTAKKLASTYPIAELVDIAISDVRNGTSRILETCGIGEVKSKAFVSWFEDYDNIDLIKTLMDICDIEEIANQQETGTGRCGGVTFVVTGSLRTFGNRDELQAYIESEGGRMASSVSKNVNYLINNDLDSGSKKNEKAKALGVQIISELGFREMFML